VRWTLDDLVSLESAQEVELDRRLGQLLAWHRHSELPRYRDWLVTMRGELAAPSLPLGHWERGGEQLGTFWGDLMRRLEPEAVALLAQLSDAQVEELIANLRQQRADRAAEWDALSQTQLARRHEKNMLKQLKRWTGRLDIGQRARVTAWAQQLQDTRAERFAQRGQWIDAFEQVLRGRADGERFAAELRPLLLEPERRWSEAYRAQLQHNTGLTLALLQDLHTHLSDRQRAALDRHLASWITRLERLSSG
jgi:uncharacterized protein YqeY